MARGDPRFNAFDVLRIVENNLTVADKRLVFAWFFSTIPIKEPKVDVLNILLDLLSAIPVAGTFAALFQVSIATAQVAVDIAELFQFEFEEQDVELARIKFELDSLRKEFDEQRQELLRCQLDLDNERERSAALLATQSLLEEEIRQLIRQLEEGVADAPAVRTAAVTIRGKANRTRDLLRGMSPARDRIFADNAQLDIISSVTEILRRV